MAEAWFLDLDGIKSGPYQTSEIYSLVAEGEILPHHRISKSLKNSEWITILDWRFAQAKMALPTQNPPEVSEAVVTAEIENNTEKETVVTEAPPLPPVEVEAEAETQVETKIEAPSPLPPPIAIPPSDTGSKKREPAAEMFEMLQNTKQKREAKSQQQLAATVTLLNKPKQELSKNRLKTIFTLIAIILIGYGMGQYFQPTDNKSLPSVAIAPSPIPSATAPPVMNETTHEETSKTEVIDRSNDKMVIRSKVERQLEHAENKKPLPEKPADNDIQDLKDLKKELQELKALKDELKGTTPSTNALPNDPDESQNDFINEDDDYSGLPPGGFNPNINENNSSPSPNTQNQPLTNPDLHY